MHNPIGYQVGLIETTHFGVEVDPEGRQIGKGVMFYLFQLSALNTLNLEILTAFVKLRLCWSVFNNVNNSNP